MWHVSVGLHVVDRGGFAIQSGLRRERGPGPGHTPFGFDGGYECGLFAADERPRPLLDEDTKVESGAQYVLAQQPQFLRL